MRLIKTGLIICILTSACYAQLHPEKICPLLFSPIAQHQQASWVPDQQLHAVTHFHASTAVQKDAPVLRPYINTYHYTAFFCKMELKTADRLGITIKVHAGDYDAYSKAYYRER